MKLRSSLLLALGALASFSVAQATTVIAPSFDQLVGNAETIFQGTVTDLSSQWVGEGADRHIVSYVTFHVEETIKGSAGASYTLRMLGGTVGEDTMEVSDSPKFQQGDRDILFVEHNGTQFVPLVGIMYGRFRVQKDQATGADVIMSNEGAVVSDVAQLGKDEHGHATMNLGATAPGNSAALSSDAFKLAIKAKLAEGAN